MEMVMNQQQAGIRQTLYRAAANNFGNGWEPGCQDSLPWRDKSN
jgi:hypothetical protein